MKRLLVLSIAFAAMFGPLVPAQAQAATSVPGEGRVPYQYGE